jgi:iron complex transport system substrate-binding protein
MGLTLRLCIILLIFGLVSVSLVVAEAGTDKKEITITDLADRTVTVKVPVDKVVLTASRGIHEVAAIEGDNFLKKIVGWGTELQVNEGDTYEKIKKIHPEVEAIPDIGDVHAGTLNTEKVISLKPDVVIIPFSSYEQFTKDIDTLQKSGIPVVVTDFWSKPLENPSKSMKIMGQLYGKEDRANEIAAYFDKKVSDIKNAVSQNKGTRPDVYLEIGSKGPDEYGSTYGDQGWGAIVREAGGNNVALGAGNGSTYAISPEFLLSKNPDRIIISGSKWENPQSLRLGYSADPSSSLEQLKKFTTRKGWNGIKAVQNNDVFGVWHAYCQRIYNFAAFEAFAKWFYPDMFPEFNPEKDIIEFHEKYMPWDYSGVSFLSLKE